MARSLAALKIDDPVTLIRAARRAISGGTFETAETIATSILAEHPTNLDALEIRALVEVERGDLVAAEKSLRSAIALAPDRRWPYGDLSRLLLKVGRPADAELVARQALEADPRNADAHAILAGLYADGEQWFEASEYFQHAIELAGPHPQLLIGRGRALLRLGKLGEARAVLESVAETDPEALEPNLYLAELHERLGQFDEATELLDRAEEIGRAQGSDVDLQRSVLLARMGQPERALSLLQDRRDLSGAARLQRGRLYDSIGRFGEAWKDWIEGKAQLAERYHRRYAADEVARQAESLRGFFGARTGAIPRAAFQPDFPQPIFIIGFPRSGTTLIEQVLASHSAIRAGGELPFGPELYERFGTNVDETIPATRLRDVYLERAKSYELLDGGARFFTDKMPDNSFWLPLLRLAFPDAPAILVRRHPLDVLTSVISHDMTHGFNCGYCLEDAGHHFALLDELLEHYRTSGFGPTYELRYETLVEDQAGETERLMAAVGLEMERAQLRFHEGGSVPSTPSYAQAREPLNARSIGRWRNFACELEPVLPIVAEAIARGGYAG